MTGIALAGPLSAEHDWPPAALAAALAVSVALVGLTAFLAAARSSTFPRHSGAITRISAIVGVMIVVFGSLWAGTVGTAAAYLTLALAVPVPYVTGAVLISSRREHRRTATAVSKK
ncbi:hypothetical protein UQW22_13645 [Isoptericola halotolerans]|uniref:hypothetical protein n=1 Tax=Isoptericola halotolerans TaxID=300560 RepID=UPI00388E8EB4